MAEIATIARPYARAAFEHAQAADGLGRWSELLAVASAAVRDERVQPLLGNPRVTAEALASFVLELAGQSGADDNTRNFVKLIAQNQRFDLLPEIAAQYEALRAEVENVVDVQLVSAIELTEPQRARFQAALERRLKRTVRLHSRIDAELVGGAIVRAGDFVIDGSLKGKVERLGQAMTN